MTCDIVGKTGIEFFGKISASISHEIKNVMATINESAGLLEDLSLMAEKGMPIDPQRIKTHAGKIMNQIRRGDVIIRNLNLLAHSVEDGEKEADLSEMLGIMAVITERIAAARGVRLEIRKPDTPAKLVTQPFFLLTLLYLCINFAMTFVGKEKKIILIAEPSKIRFAGLDSLSESPITDFPNDAAKALLAALDLELVSDTEKKEIGMTKLG